MPFCFCGFWSQWIGRRGCQSLSRSESGRLSPFRSDRSAYFVACPAGDHPPRRRTPQRQEGRPGLRPRFAWVSSCRVTGPECQADCLRRRKGDRIVRMSRRCGLQETEGKRWWRQSTFGQCPGPSDEGMKTRDVPCLTHATRSFLPPPAMLQHREAAGSAAGTDRASSLHFCRRSPRQGTIRCVFRGFQSAPRNAVPPRPHAVARPKGRRFFGRVLVSTEAWRPGKALFATGNAVSSTRHSKLSLSVPQALSGLL